MADTVATKPLSVGDLIGRGIRFYRSNILLVIQVLMWPTIISVIGRVAMQWSITMIARKDLSNWPLIAVGVIAGFVITICASFILMLRNLALVRMANGFAPTFKEAYQHLKGRVGTLIGTMAIAYFVVIGALMIWGVEITISALMYRPGSVLLVACFLGMVIGVIGMVLSGLIVSVLYFIVLSVVACEQKNLGTSISRACSLTFADLGRSCLLGCLLLIIYCTLSYPLSLPAVAVSFFEAFRNGITSTASDPAKMPLYVMVLSQTWESIVHMILSPITWLPFGLFYYDLRVRQEGIDVLQSLKLLEQPGGV